MPTLESVEWLNAFLKTMWGLVNPDMCALPFLQSKTYSEPVQRKSSCFFFLFTIRFIPIADTLEDVMQASLPGFVDAIRISDIGQGTNPMRIISMRALPDQPGDKEYPRREWIEDGKPPGSKPSDGVDGVEKRAMQQGEEREDDDSGDYVVSCLYRGLFARALIIDSAPLFFVFRV